MTWPQVFSTGNDCMVIRKQRERQIRPAGFSPGSRPVHRPAFCRSKLQPFSVPKIWGTRGRCDRARSTQSVSSRQSI